MFTATLLAVVAIFVQSESIMAGTHIRADRVAALLLTATVVYRALVFVCKVIIILVNTQYTNSGIYFFFHTSKINSCKSSLLHGIIRCKFDS